MRTVSAEAELQRALRGGGADRVLAKVFVHGPPGVTQFRDSGLLSRCAVVDPIVGLFLTVVVAPLGVGATTPPPTTTTPPRRPPQDALQLHRMHDGGLPRSVVAGDSGGVLDLTRHVVSVCALTCGGSQYGVHVPPNVARDFLVPAQRYLVLVASPDDGTRRCVSEPLSFVVFGRAPPRQ